MSGDTEHRLPVLCETCNTFLCALLRKSELTMFHCHRVVTFAVKMKVFCFTMPCGLVVTDASEKLAAYLFRGAEEEIYVLEI